MIKITRYTHFGFCEIDLANDTGAPTISPENKLNN